MYQGVTLHCAGKSKSAWSQVVDLQVVIRKRVPDIRYPFLHNSLSAKHLAPRLQATSAASGSPIRDSVSLRLPLSLVLPEGPAKRRMQLCLFGSLGSFRLQSLTKTSLCPPRFQAASAASPSLEGRGLGRG